MSSEERFREYREYIQQYLEEYYSRFDSQPQKRLFEAIRYSLLAGGKRLRPIFAFEFCRLAGGDWKNAAPFAGAIEMIHTYSLIHDDLPCMDNDDYRRGRLTNHKVFGEAMAVLAGDALLTDAFALASTAKLPNPAQMSLAIGVLSENAGSLGMVGGQVLDMLSQQRECSEQEVLDIQSRKTGALINAACVLGAIAGGAGEAQIKAAAGFAGCLGLAFQIRDDMLDVIGDAGELGKATGHDADKNTFVRLYGLEKCEELVQKYTNAAIEQLQAFQDAGDLISLAQSLTARRT
ncbi:MAG: polyprenyl synthetase family protein [Firmicutes bacterium]|nr:polyprenyl synthetase family protein [Bacillota bacterium]MDY6160980.1 farnesyl diphosphate synthase [Candidatus Faecousia sp.]